MDVRLFDVTGKTLARATLERGTQPKDLLRAMQKHQLFVTPWEEPKQAAAAAETDKQPDPSDDGKADGKADGKPEGKPEAKTDGKADGKPDARGRQGR